MLLSSNEWCSWARAKKRPPPRHRQWSPARLAAFFRPQASSNEIYQTKQKNNQRPRKGQKNNHKNHKINDFVEIGKMIYSRPAKAGTDIVCSRTVKFIVAEMSSSNSNLLASNPQVLIIPVAKNEYQYLYHVGGKKWVCICMYKCCTVPCCTKKSKCLGWSPSLERMRDQALSDWAWQNMSLRLSTSYTSPVHQSGSLGQFNPSFHIQFI